MHTLFPELVSDRPNSWRDEPGNEIGMSTCNPGRWMGRPDDWEFGQWETASLYINQGPWCPRGNRSQSCRYLTPWYLSLSPCLSYWRESRSQTPLPLSGCPASSPLPGPAGSPGNPLLASAGAPLAPLRATPEPCAVLGNPTWLSAGAGWILSSSTGAGF